MRIKAWMIIGVVLCLLSSCKSDYEKLVQSEMASGETYEDLMFDLKMGQTKKQFYEQCWELNKNQQISQGPTNENVLYLIPTEQIPSDTNKVEMLFFGIFDDDDVMRGLRQRFFYTAWSIWNKQMQSDKLIEKVKEYYQVKYGGNEFMELDLGLDGKARGFVKVDGNRQITVYQKDHKEVGGRIEDLRYKLKKGE